MALFSGSGIEPLQHRAFCLNFVQKTDEHMLVKKRWKFVCLSAGGGVIGEDAEEPLQGSVRGAMLRVVDGGKGGRGE